MLLIPEVEKAGLGLPMDETVRRSAYAGVAEARTRLDLEAGPTLPAQVAHAQRLARSVVCFLGHLENPGRAPDAPNHPSAKEDLVTEPTTERERATEPVGPGRRRTDDMAGGRLARSDIVRDDRHGPEPDRLAGASRRAVLAIAELTRFE
ncbi:hypothetical protein QF035_004476 [Streptomyces umbrinus]|uniref:Uncharacterized protein n=1 Tax=Streptomyces umbrinus TaxID=67370 RepID=A0ABU0STL3_9ACTN|nr:DUF6415 family natural product biosynthesis protein [Streptomyces umbrinus]MDQ1026894.1 hypothetical protein [Streptomyces umbrinus]